MKIDNDKNKLLIIKKPRLDNLMKNFYFKAENKVVRAQFKIKILGTWIQNDMKLDSDINKLSSTLHNRINIIKKINKYTDFNSRLNFINGFVMGKLNYMIPMYNKLYDNLLHYIYMHLLKVPASLSYFHLHKKNMRSFTKACKCFILICVH